MIARPRYWSEQSHRFREVPEGAWKILDAMTHGAQIVRWNHEYAYCAGQYVHRSTVGFLRKLGWIEISPAANWKLTEFRKKIFLCQRFGAPYTTPVTVEQIEEGERLWNS